eukprot:s4305_g2.t1
MGRTVHCDFHCSEAGADAGKEGWKQMNPETDHTCAPHIGSMHFGSKLYMGWRANLSGSCALVAASHEKH